MTLIFRVDLGIIKVDSCAKFHDPETIGLAFTGLNAFCVRALKKKEKRKNKETNSVKIYKAVLKHLPNYHIVILITIEYCRVPEGRGLHQTARPPSRDETRSVNPLVLTCPDLHAGSVLTDC